ncbi:MAG: branched-chain amino acid aminotransferase [Flavobacteriaceae bacterium]|nr:branched-chain amino acid aminotransferase [Flavobacteriaceae bacterium]
MQQQNTLPIEIKRIESSKINQVDFENLTFGNVFTDYMLSCDYVDGKWQNPVIEPYGTITISPGARVFHYGQAIFEGMKAYRDEQDDVWLFRPEENFIRFNKSSVRLAIPEVPREVFFEGLQALLNLDKHWCPKGYGNSLYIRPFVFGNQVGVSAAPSSNYKFMILLSPVNAYYKGDVKVLIAENYSRAANGGVGAAKAAGNYGAQFYPTNLAKEKGFDQIIWTDDCSHQYLEEAGTMNVFFRINDTLITAPTSDRILDGVTRKSIIDLAQRDGLAVEVRKITVTELIDAAKNKSLKEIFGAGTAAVISPVSGFGFKEDYFDLPSLEDSFAKRMKKSLLDIQHNKAEDTFNWTYKV